jgi:peptidoglycan/LPS O-acetylase OafA/YrhL
VMLRNGDVQMTDEPTGNRGASRVHFDGIDVLRGLAALTVVFSHYIPFWDRYLGNILVILPNAVGYYAVKLFFVISGMVILMTLDRCSSATDFALLRFSRLYPAYWTTLGIATFVGVVIFGKSFWLGGFVVNGTMFQEFLGFGNLDNVYWSLTVELAFYLNVAWLLALGFHKRVLTCLGVWLFASGIWTVAVHDPSLDGRDWLALLFALDYAPYFAIGILFYNGRGRRWRPCEIGLLVVALVVEYGISSWEGVAVAVASSALVFAAISGYLEFMTSRFSLWLGAISYSLYLVHRNIGYGLLPRLHEHGFDPVSAIALTTLLAVGLAAGVTFWVERPASRLLRSRFKKMDHV